MSAYAGGDRGVPSLRAPVAAPPPQRITVSLFEVARITARGLAVMTATRLIGLGDGGRRSSST